VLELCGLLCPGELCLGAGRVLVRGAATMLTVAVAVTWPLLAAPLAVPVTVVVSVTVSPAGAAGGTSACACSSLA
jgi:hypothetical protein